MMMIIVILIFYRFLGEQTLGLRNDLEYVR